MFHTKVVQQIKTHILCPVLFFLIVSFMSPHEKHVVELDRPEMAI